MTTKREDTGVTRRQVLTVALGVGAVGAVAWLVAYLTRPPQMGADDGVFHTVDALFTAVRARDENLLGQCEQRLNALKDAGKLPKSASKHLDGIIGQARAGRWAASAERLYDFMAVQRREGPHEPPKKKEKGRQKPGRVVARGPA